MHAYTHIAYTYIDKDKHIQPLSYFYPHIFTHARSMTSAPEATTLAMSAW